MTDWRGWAAVFFALGNLAQAVALWQLAQRVHSLELEVRHLDGRVTIPEFVAVGGTGNVHRVKLGWRVRVVMWWVGVRERLRR